MFYSYYYSLISDFERRNSTINQNQNIEVICVSKQQSDKLKEICEHHHYNKYYTINQIEFINYIPLDNFKQIIKDLYHCYLKEVPFGDKTNFIQSQFEYFIYECKELLTIIRWSGGKWIDTIKKDNCEFDFYYYSKEYTKRIICWISQTDDNLNFYSLYLDKLIEYLEIDFFNESEIIKIQKFGNYNSKAKFKIYHSFSEFSENYENDFREWSTIYYNGQEINFIDNLISEYDFENKSFGWGDYSVDEENNKYAVEKIINWLIKRKENLQKNTINNEEFEENNTNQHDNVFSNNGFELFSYILENHIAGKGQRGRYADISFYYWKLYKNTPQYIHQRPEVFRKWFCEFYDENFEKIRTELNTQNRNRNNNFTIALNQFRKK